MELLLAILGIIFTVAASWLITSIIFYFARGGSIKDVLYSLIEFMKDLKNNLIEIAYDIFDDDNYKESGRNESAN